MRRDTIIWNIFLWVAVLNVVACGEPPGETADNVGSPSSTDEPPTPPAVTDGSKQLLFSWFEGNEAKTATDVAEIPDGVRKEVRVQDLSTPPEQRRPDWLFLADLTAKDNAGKYHVRAVRRAEYEEKRHPVQAAPEKPDARQAGKSPMDVIMYSTAHCPHCKRARRWLLEQKIPYKEFDIEKDDVAAKELYEKCQAQSIMPGGVPMFDVNGQIVPGFSPEAILQLLKQPPNVAPQQMPNPTPAPTVPPSAPSGKPANTSPVPVPSTGITI